LWIRLKGGRLLSMEVELWVKNYREFIDLHRNYQLFKKDCLIKLG